MEEIKMNEGETKTFLEKFREKYDLGFPIFKELFDMNKEELKEKLIEICETHLKDNLDVIKEGSITKTIVDDVPEKIKIEYYNSVISILPLGITYKPEHKTEIPIVEFNKFFKLS